MCRPLLFRFYDQDKEYDDETDPWIQGMEELIKQAFEHVAVIGPQVQNGQYDLIGPNGEIILPKIWDETIQPGWDITMQMWPMPDRPAAVPVRGHAPNVGVPHMPPRQHPQQAGPRVMQARPGAIPNQMPHIRPPGPPGAVPPPPNIRPTAIPPVGIHHANVHGPIPHIVTVDPAKSKKKPPPKPSNGMLSFLAGKPIQTKKYDSCSCFDLVPGLAWFF